MAILSAETKADEVEMTGKTAEQRSAEGWR